MIAVDPLTVCTGDTEPNRAERPIRAKSGTRTGPFLQRECPRHSAVTRHPKAEQEELPGYRKSLRAIAIRAGRKLAAPGILLSLAQPCNGIAIAVLDRPKPELLIG